MKFTANEYTPQEICKILREWTELTQKDFGKTINRSERSIRTLENGERHLTVQTLLNIANTHGIKVIIEKEANSQK